jgi:endonuclease YncB( thermonuclease family)
MRHSIAFLTIILLIASMAIGYRADDWSRYDHQSVRVVAAITGDCLQIETASGKTDTVALLGAAESASTQAWLQNHVAGKQLTLLLESPQTRDPAGRLRAFAFLGNQNLSVELVKAGQAYADRREKTEMDALIDPAEADARKKKRGLWASLRPETMPAWRQAWMKSLPQRR